MYFYLVDPFVGRWELEELEIVRSDLSLSPRLPPLSQRSQHFLAGEKAALIAAQKDPMNLSGD